MMHWMLGDYGMGFGPGMGIFMFFFWFLIILGIVLLVRATLGGCRKRDGAESGDESAEEILNKRYARGEISADEFKKMKEHLRG